MDGREGKGGGGPRRWWRPGGRARVGLRAALLWRGTLVREATVAPGGDLHAGFDPHCDLVVPDLAALGAWRLARAAGGDWRVHVQPDMQGRFHGEAFGGPGGTTVATLAATAAPDPGGAFDVPLAPGDWALLHFGDVEVFLSPVRMDAIAAGRTFGRADGVHVAANVAAAVLLVALVVGSQLATSPAGGTEVRPSDRREPRIEVMLSVPSSLEIPEAPPAAEPSVPGLAADGPEGSFGDPALDPSVTPRVPRRDGRLVHRFDPTRMGLAGALGDRERRPEALSAVMDGDAERFANRLAVASAGSGSEYVPGFGAGGMGLRGTGPGGGGDSPAGRLKGGGRWDGDGPGTTPRAGLSPRRARAVGGFEVREPTVSAFCRSDDLRRVVMQRSAAIRACYEAELAVRPDLRGKLVMRWTVGTDGRAEDVRVAESSLPARAVESCVSRVLGNARFVAPVGGVCVVQWPFAFHPG